MPHRTDIWFGLDADYVVYTSFVDGRWREHMRWMIPGSQVD